MCTPSQTPDQRRSAADKRNFDRALRQEKDRDRRGIIFRRLADALHRRLGAPSAA